MLILWDIDSTLLDTRGAGMNALKAAVFQHFGEESPTLDLGGATDLGLMAQLHAHFDKSSSKESIEAFFEIYLGELHSHLHDESFRGHLLPGALELMDWLEQQGGVYQALLTGNLERGAHLKLKRFGLSERLRVGAFGDDFADRNQLGPLALRRAEQQFGRAFCPHTQVLVIGDTLKDIACAKAMGAACLAVASGHTSKEVLRSGGAECVVARLDEVKTIEWLNGWIHQQKENGGGGGI